MKAADDDAWLTAAGDQVSRYWDRYRLVLVTNTRDFVLVGEDVAGRPAKLETFRLAASAAEFTQRLESPRAFAGEVGTGLGEYLCRALSHRARLVEPKDLAWLLASHARDALARVEAAGDAPSLAAVRAALEEALGVRFEGERGGAVFPFDAGADAVSTGCSPLGCCGRGKHRCPRERSIGAKRFGICGHPSCRRCSSNYRSLTGCKPLGLVEVLDWTSAALDRVDCDAFFDRFNEGEAVTYFYEPFLEAFDPELRKTTRRLVHASRSGALHGRPRR